MTKSINRFLRLVLACAVPTVWEQALTADPVAVTASIAAPLPQTPVARPEIDAVLRALPKVEPGEVLDSLRAPAPVQSWVGEDGIPYIRHSQTGNAQPLPMPAARITSAAAQSIAVGTQSIAVEAQGVSAFPMGGSVTLIPEPVPIAALSVVSLQAALWMLARKRRQRETSIV